MLFHETITSWHSDNDGPFIKVLTNLQRQQIRDKICSMPTYMNTLGSVVYWSPTGRQNINKCFAECLAIPNNMYGITTRCISLHGIPPHKYCMYSFDDYSGHIAKNSSFFCFMAGARQLSWLLEQHIHHATQIIIIINNIILSSLSLSSL